MSAMTFAERQRAAATFAALPPEQRQQMAHDGLVKRIFEMAMSVQCRQFSEWPAWSTGELLMVALVLNSHAALASMGYTVLEAIDRVDVDAVTLRQIERRLRT